MKMRCLACGVKKETSELEVYPYPDDGIVDSPIKPLSVIHCQGPTTDWRAVVVCNHCLHKLEPDQWISSTCWASLNPLTPFAQLPAIRETPSGRGPHELELYAEDAKG